MLTWRINDGVVPILSEELLGCAGNCHTTLTLLLSAVHVEGESERRLAKGGGLLLQLVQLTFRDTAQLEEQTTSSGRLARVDMATTARTGRLSGQHSMSDG